MASERIRHAWLRALGPEDLPETITVEGQDYARLRTYKHDFFAATGLYEGDAGRVILKIGRRVSMFGLPMRWLGRYLTGHELALYEAAAGIEGVPRCLGRWDATGMVHAFVEGHPLQRHERVADDFFPRLAALLDTLHARDIAYVDLEKRENILVDAEGNPALIDFQISFWWPADWAKRPGLAKIIPGPVGRWTLKRLQRADRYHLMKHHRRHRPDQLTPEAMAASYRHGPLIALHRLLFRPITLLRRRVLLMLTGRARSAKQDGPEFVESIPPAAERGNADVTDQTG